MKRLMIVLMTTTSASMFVSAHASTIVAPVTVSSPQGELSFRPLVDIINQSGLSASYTAGSTDFLSFANSTTHDPLLDTGFTGVSSVGPQVFTFDFGQIVTIDAISVWNTDSAGAISSFSLASDTDDDFGNGTSGTVLGPSALATNAADPTGQVFTFSPVATQFIHFAGLSTLDPPDFYGLGEVAFRSASGAEIPLPGALPLFATGLGLLGLRRGRRR